MPDVYEKTLARAADIAGGEAELALRLNVTPSHLHLWIAGVNRPPLDVFLKAVDIVVEHDQTGRSRPLMAKAEDGASDGASD